MNRFNVLLQRSRASTAVKNRLKQYKGVLLVLLCFLSLHTSAQVDSLLSFSASAARQAVAVDNEYFYAIDNRTIEKYDKSSGQLVQVWTDTSGFIQHLNSGVIYDGKLYCAHSNYPKLPMKSSIEIFDVRNLEHIGSHSFGIDVGSATWLDIYEGHWYVAFAHYERFEKKINKSNEWTQLVKFNKDWSKAAGWTMPDDLLEKFGKASNSGGVITSQGELLLTGHDFQELYIMRFPKMGSDLVLQETVAAPFKGQGIAVDPADEKIIYGIQGDRKIVVKGKRTIKE